LEIITGTTDEANDKIKRTEICNECKGATEKGKGDCYMITQK
jgi:hypothetical protein